MTFSIPLAQSLAEKDTVPLSLLVVLPASRVGRRETMTPQCYLSLTTPFDLGVRLPTLTETEENEKQCALNGAGRGSFSAHLSHRTLWGSCVLRTVICDTGDREL